MSNLTKQTIRLLSVIISLSLLSFQTFAASGTGASSVTVEDPVLLTLTEVELLNFGTLSASERNGTVTVSPTSGASSSSFVVVTTPGKYATWSINGVPATQLDITIPTTPTSVSNGSSSMTVDNFHRYNANSYTLNNSGTLAIYIGATLQVNANQPAGVYTGSYNVTVSYL